MSDVVLTDKITGITYKIALYDGVLMLIGAEETPSTNVFMQDEATLTRYSLILAGGILKLLEVV